MSGSTHLHSQRRRSWSHSVARTTDRLQDCRARVPESGHTGSASPAHGVAAVNLKTPKSPKAVNRGVTGVRHVHRATRPARARHPVAVGAHPGGGRGRTRAAAARKPTTAGGAGRALADPPAG